MNKAKALAYYNKTVECNLKNIKKDQSLKDPDCRFTEEIIVCHPYMDNSKKDKLIINISSDGICGEKALTEICKEYPKEYDKVQLYGLLRKGRFECLLWPAYAMSINQMRYSIFRDRIDLTLKDIQVFYDVISDKKFSIDSISAIERECRLSRAYLNTYTLAWLCSFTSFDDFITKRKLEFLISLVDGEYKAEAWAGHSINIISDDYRDYFEKLVEKMTAQVEIENE